MTYYEGCFHCIFMTKMASVDYKEHLDGVAVNERRKAQDAIMRGVLAQTGKWSDEAHEMIVNQINSEGVALTESGQLVAIINPPPSRIKQVGFGVLSE